MLYVFAVQKINGVNTTTILRHPQFFNNDDDMRLYFQNQSVEGKEYGGMCFETDEKLSVNEFRKVRNKYIGKEYVKKEQKHREVCADCRKEVYKATEKSSG